MEVQQAGDKATPGASATGANLLDIIDSIKTNALAPAANGLLIEPGNAILNVVNGVIDVGTATLNKALGKDFSPPESPKIPQFEVENAAPGTIAAYSQQLSETAGSVLAYAAASKLAGGALRGAGQLVSLDLTLGGIKTGGAIRALAQDSRFATVVGGTAYAAAKDTRDGETHTSNAVGALVGFSFFEAGNTLIKPGGALSEKFMQRYVVGSVGGVLQANASSLWLTGKGADLVTAQSAALSGGLLNALLPAGHGAIDGIAEHPSIGARPNLSEAAARLHAKSAALLPESFAPEPGSWADPNAIKALNKAARADLHTKLVVDSDRQTHIVHSENTIYSGKNDDPLSVLQELAHARVLKKPEYEQQFQAHAEKLVSADPVDPRNAAAKEAYIQTRLSQEIAARAEQNAQAQALRASRRVSIDRDEIRNTEGYGLRFAEEADQFVASGGKFRPEVDYSSGDNPHEYSRVKTGDTTIHTFKNIRVDGLTRNTFTQHQDGTVVGFGFENNGRIRVEFAGGNTHNVSLGEPISHVRVVDNNDGTYRYHFNKKNGEPQLTVTSRYNEMKVLPGNGDKVLITEVDGEGATLPFSDGSKLYLKGDGTMAVYTPGLPEKVARLGEEPRRLAVLERANGSKLFQLANADASRNVQIEMGPPARKLTQAPQQTTTMPPPVDKRYSPRSTKGTPPRDPRDLPKEFRTERIQGGANQSSAGHDVFDSGFSGDQQTESDRYPFQPNLYQDPAHVLTGVDQRSALDLHDPSQVELGQMHLYGPLEHHLANLGRHETDDNDGWPF